MDIEKLKIKIAEKMKEAQDFVKSEQEAIDELAKKHQERLAAARSKAASFDGEVKALNDLLSELDKKCCETKDKKKE